MAAGATPVADDAAWVEDVCAVPAFYRARGCQLATVDPAAYPHLPHEIQLIWRLDLRDA